MSSPTSAVVAAAAAAAAAADVALATSVAPRARALHEPASPRRVLLGQAMQAVSPRGSPLPRRNYLHLSGSSNSASGAMVVPASALGVAPDADGLHASPTAGLEEGEEEREDESESGVQLRPGRGRRRGRPGRRQSVASVWDMGENGVLSCALRDAVVEGEEAPLHNLPALQRRLDDPVHLRALQVTSLLHLRLPSFVSVYFGHTLAVRYSPIASLALHVCDVDSQLPCLCLAFFTVMGC